MRPGGASPAPDARRVVRAVGPPVPRTTGERLLPVASGLLLVLSFPPFALLVPPFVALVPLLVLVAEQPAGREGRWRATRAGYFAGVVYFGLLLYWLPVALLDFPELAIPAYLLTVLILAGFTGAFAAGLQIVRERTPVPFPLAVATLWTAAEWAPGHLLGDLSFPWLGLGTSVAAFPRVAGAADLAGARGLTFWIALVNGMIVSALMAHRAGRHAGRIALAGLAVLAGPVAYGAWRAATLELRPAAVVAVVQPNIPQDLKMRRAEAVDSTLRALDRLMARISPGSVDLVVWPEVTLPAVLTRGGLERPIRALSDRVDAPILAGAYGLEGDPSGDHAFYNSAFVVTREGLTPDVYHKRYLVPFVERVPFVDGPQFPEAPGAGRVGTSRVDARYFGGLSRGTGAPVFTAGDARYGVLICFESIFAMHARRYRRARADFLVNLTNDAWYGREAWYARTTALWQHPAHLSMRAIEARVGIARAANTGISMFVDPLGRTYENTELFTPGVRTAVVYTTEAVTLFVRWGDWLATAAAVAAVGMVVAAWLAGSRPGARERRAAPGVSA